MKRWYIAKSNPRKEGLLGACLTELGVEVYYPSIVARKKHRKDSDDVFEPLFPTYLFCRMDANHIAAPTVRWAPGLSYFLGAGGYPSSISDDVVNYIKERVHQWNSQEMESQRLSTGDRVMVTDGPFASFEGIFQKYTRPWQRCRILLQVAGRLANVELDEHVLVAKHE